MRRYTMLLPLASAFLLNAYAQEVAQTHIAATGLCNTGLTHGGLLPIGCTKSTLVTPINPESGGTSVDGNWQLATPYPSAPYNHDAPDTCLLTSFGPAWVDTPPSYFFNPDDGLSQWITPLVDVPNTAGGWYVYATALRVPPISTGYARYVLTVSGQLMADDQVPAIFLLSPSIGCKVVALPSLSPVVGSNFVVHNAWNPFSFVATVAPDTTAYLYFLVYNLEVPAPNQNGTGLRVEFTSGYFTPE